MSAFYNLHVSLLDAVSGERSVYVRRRQKAHYSVPSVKPFFFILYLTAL